MLYSYKITFCFDFSDKQISERNIFKVAELFSCLQSLLKSRIGLIVEPLVVNSNPPDRVAVFILRDDFKGEKEKGFSIELEEALLFGRELLAVIVNIFAKHFPDWTREDFFPLFPVPAFNDGVGLEVISVATDANSELGIPNLNELGIVPRLLAVVEVRLNNFGLLSFHGSLIS